MKLGGTEFLIVLAVVLILFGPTQIPKLTRMFKKSTSSFKEGMDEAEQEKITQNGPRVDVNAETRTAEKVESGADDYREV